MIDIDLTDDDDAVLSVDITEKPSKPEDPERHRLWVQAHAVMHQPDGCRVEFTSPGTSGIHPDTDGFTIAEHARRELKILEDKLPDSDRIRGKAVQIVNDLEAKAEQEEREDSEDEPYEGIDHADGTDRTDDLDDDWDWLTRDRTTQLKKLRVDLLQGKMPMTEQVFDAIDALAANPNILWSRHPYEGLRGSLTGELPSMHSHLTPATIQREEATGDEYDPQPARWVHDDEPGCLGPIALLERVGYPATPPAAGQHLDAHSENTIQGVAAVHTAVTGKKGMRHSRLTKDAALWLMLEAAAMPGTNTDDLILKFVDRTMMTAETVALVSAYYTIHEYLHSRIDHRCPPLTHIAP